MPIVNVPGVGRVRFPDSMSQEQIITAIETDILKKPEAPSGEGSWLGDVGRSFAQGVVGAGKSLVDVFGAETVPSQYLEGVQQQLQQGLTPTRQAEIQRRRQLEEEASKSGNLLNEIGTFLGGVAEAPVQSLAQGLGSIVPFVGTGVVGGIAKLGAPAVRALNTVVGAAMGTGSVKGSLYDNVEAELKKQGMAPEEAKAKAQQAQSYLGENFLSIVGGGALGAVGARTGVEKLLTKEGKEAAAAGVGRRVGKAILEEAPVEAAQAGQEQLAVNLALQRQGIDVDTFRGVAGAAARDAAIGALAAGTVGAVRGPEAQRPTPAPEAEAAPEVPPTPEAPLTPEEQAKRDTEAKLTGIDFGALSQAAKTGTVTMEEAPAAAPAAPAAATEVDVTAAAPAAPSTGELARVLPIIQSMGFTDLSKITTPEQQTELVRLVGRYVTEPKTIVVSAIKNKIGKLLETGNVEPRKAKGGKDAKPIVGGEQQGVAGESERRDVSGEGVGVSVSKPVTDASAAAEAGRGGLDVAQGPAAAVVTGEGQPAGALTTPQVAAIPEAKQDLTTEEQAALQDELQAEQAGEVVAPEVSTVEPIRQPRERRAAESVTEEQALEAVTAQSADLSDIANAVKTIEETKDREKYKQAVQYLVATAGDKSGTSKGARRAAELALNRIPETDRQTAAQELVQLAEIRKNQQLRNVSGKIQKLDYRIEQLTNEYKDAVKNRDNDTLATVKKELNELTEQRKGLIKEQRTVEKAEVLLRRAAGNVKGMALPEAQRIVDRIKAKWKGAPKIEVAFSYDTLPRPIREFLTANDAEDARGVFYTPTQTVYIIAANNDTEASVGYTLAHETIGHFGLRKVLGDKYTGMMNLAYMNPAVKALADNYVKQNPGTSKAVSVEEALAELVELGQADSGRVKQLMNRIVAMLRQFLRFITNNKIAKQFSDSEVRDLLSSARNTVEEGGVSTTTADTTAPMALFARADEQLKAKAAMAETPEKELEEFTKAISEKYEADMTKASLYKRVRGLFTSAEGRTELVRRFQNDRVVAKRLEDVLSKTGMLKSSGEQLNNIYTQLTLASGRADEAFNTHVYFPLKDLEQSIFEYTKASGLDLNDALQQLHRYMVGLHEQERRQVKYIRTVPLDNTTKITVKELGITDTPAEIRRRIYQTLDRNEDLVKSGEAKFLRNLLNSLVDKYKKEDGSSPNEYKSTDINSDEYNVVAELSQDAVNLIRTQLRNDPNNAMVSKIMVALKKVHDGTTELNKQANYWTQPVSNYVDFYGYKNYVPFKGRPEPRVGANEEYGREGFDDPNSKRMSGDFVDAAQSFEGRTSISQNPLLQSMADAARASLRLARRDATTAVYNLVTDENNPIGKKLVAGAIKNIPFNERDKTDFKQYSGNNYIYRYRENGSIDVIKLKDPSLVEAIRRSFRKSQPLIQMLNAGTSLMGQLHTRYNPAFAPMNFVRDAFTNAAIMGVEGKAGFDYLSAVASKVVSGGMFKVGKVAKLYAQRNMAAIREMAKTDDFIKDMLEYIEAGGRVSYVQGITAMGQMDELVKDIGRNRLIRGKEQLDKWVDVWTDTFELASRTAAYGVAKKQALAEGKSEADARVIAAAYAKNLANFEQVGEWGRAAGAMFMFFRPAATGAVRAIDALSPAFQNVDELIKRLPDNIRGNADAVAKFREAHLKQQAAARRMMAAIAGAGAALYIMAWMMSDDDEMDRNRIATDDMARWTRYLRLPIPGTSIFLQVPWGFGVSAFAAGGAQVAGAVLGKTSVGDMLGNIATIGLDSFLPIPVSRINPIENPAAWAVDSMLPSLARPLVEYMMNVDSLGREIYNNRKTRYGDAYTGGDNIPELYKDVTRMLANVSGGDVDVSPNTLYFFANNYLDAVTRVTHNLYNMGLVMAGKKDFDPKTDTMFFDSFIGKKSNFDAREFSSVEKQINAKIGRMKMFREANPEKFVEYLEKYPMDPALEEIYNKSVGGVLKPLREAANDVRKMSLDPKERKQILDELNLAQNMVKRALIDTFKEYNIHP